MSANSVSSTKVDGIAGDVILIETDGKPLLPWQARQFAEAIILKTYQAEGRKDVPSYR